MRKYLIDTPVQRDGKLHKEGFIELPEDEAEELLACKAIRELPEAEPAKTDNTDPVWDDPKPEDLAKLSVSALTEGIAVIQSKTKLEAVLAAEKAGQNRKGAIEAIEARIAELGE